MVKWDGRQMSARTIWLAAGAILLGIAAAGAGQVKSTGSLMSLGRHLAQECTSCHRVDGADNSIPPIVGLDPEMFVSTLGFYRNGQRSNPTMVSVAQSLDDEQIRALALYFGSLPKPQSMEASNESATGADNQKR